MKISWPLSLAPVKQPRPKRFYVAAVCLSALLATLSLSLVSSTGTSSHSAQAADNCQSFPETGFSVCGRFLEYFNANGGVRQQGYPISDVFNERNAAPPAGDGNVHKVQYFQRARFEEHLENPAPNDVLLGLLGAEQYAKKYIPADLTGQPLQVRGKRFETAINGTAAKPGSVFLVLDVLLTNNSNKAFTSYVGSFLLNTTGGYDYSVAGVTYGMTKSLKAKELFPGDSAGGELAFEIGANEGAKTLSFATYPVDFKTSVP